jgi:deoxyribodipyrimidine photolyase
MSRMQQSVTLPSTWPDESRDRAAHVRHQVVFEKDEVLTRDSRLFSVFTAHRNACLQRLASACAIA